MKNRLMEQMRPLEQTVESFPWKNKEAYSWFIAQTYYYVCHSTRLLALSAARFGIRQDHLHKRFIEHIREEKNHERLALNDLKNLKADLFQYPELPVTRTFYEPQYYKIEFEAPTALLGYILALEGISVQRMGWVHRLLVETYGENCASFIKLHAAEDVDHVEKAFQQLESLSTQEIAYIEQNFIQSCDIYGRILMQCAEKGSGFGRARGERAESTTLSQ